MFQAEEILYGNVPYLYEEVLAIYSPVRLTIVMQEATSRSEPAVWVVALPAVRKIHDFFICLFLQNS